MSIRSVAAQNASLDGNYGTTRGSGCPGTHYLALFDGDPLIDGVEVTGGSYARVAIAAADWDPAAGGAKTTTNPVTFADATAAWGQVTHYGLFGSDGNWWDCGPLTQTTIISGAGAGPVVLPVVFYDDSVLIPS